VTSEQGPGPEGTALPRALVEATSALVCVVDGEGRVLLANPALQRFTGRSAAELLGQDFCDVYIVPEDVALARDAVARAMATGVAYPQEGDWLAAGGRRRRVSMHTDVLADEAGVPYAVVCIGFDVTVAREREAQLHRRTRTDLLTGMANRSALFEELRDHLDPETGKGCGVLFCDLDQFKVVNDRFGHAVGDALLVDVARRLCAVADADDLVARFGGDEFVLVCRDGDPDRLTALADQVREQVGRPFAGPMGELSVGVSVGIAIGQPGEAPDDLVIRADRAMYGAKHGGESGHARRAARDPSQEA
jgi:diguanylate cyclase (GGDEF)-like protein/PAS domain S-box-containing protein